MSDVWEKPQSLINSLNKVAMHLGVPMEPLTYKKGTDDESLS